MCLHLHVACLHAQLFQCKQNLVIILIDMLKRNPLLTVVILLSGLFWFECIIYNCPTVVIRVFFYDLLPSAAPSNTLFVQLLQPIHSNFPFHTFCLFFTISSSHTCTSLACTSTCLTFTPALPPSYKTLIDLNSLCLTPYSGRILHSFSYAHYHTSSPSLYFLPQLLYHLLTFPLPLLKPHCSSFLYFILQYVFPWYSASLR